MNTYGIIRCPYGCGAIEYNQDDLMVGGDHEGLMEIYIECPECGRPITVGVTPTLAAITNMYTEEGGEIW